ncbi:F10A5.4 [Arabidopsis thaliana]|uniref:F10A5.4 n=1 Tax=Arabidopsis thaliana TaxID=3702 RepID=Q9LR16_ARATH|nr:F10A5.4 [Arabidopsis thaliana]
MSKKKKTQSLSMEDHRDGKGKKRDDFFDSIDYEISSILLQLSHPVIFSSDSPVLHKWGRTKKRSSSSSHLHPPEPVIKSLPCMADVGDMGSNSSSSCLTGEAKKTNSQIEKSEFFSPRGVHCYLFIFCFPFCIKKSEEGFQRVPNKVQVAAQARQRRLGLIRSKKLFNRFISSYQFK